MIGQHNQPSSSSQPPKQKKTPMAILRLQKDLKDFQSSKINYISLQFPTQQSIQQIIVTIKLNLTKQQIQTNNTPYNHIIIKFQLSFPNQYPINPPKLKCLNKIYHPNINYNGSVCLPLVRQDWSPTVTLQAIIYGLIFILLYPNADDALQPQIGDQMKSDYKLYDKIVQHTIQGRVFKQKQYDKIRN